MSARADWPDLAGPRVRLRAPRAEDLPRLFEILAEPGVLRWWGPQDAASAREDLVEPPGAYAIEADGELVGWIGVEEEDDPMYRRVGVDLFLAAAAQRRGLGPEAIRLVLRHARTRGHHRATIDPAAENERAVRAYAAVGFRPVGTMRAYERAPDGRWRDGLLMDLLLDELDGDGVPGSAGGAAG